MTELTFTFLAPEKGAQTSGQARSIINGHIARLTHRKRRWRQQQEKSELVRLGSTEVLDGSQCGSHGRTVVPQCSWCQQAASANIPVLPHYGNSDPFDSLPMSLDARAYSYLSFGQTFIGPLVRGIGPPDLVMRPGQPQLKVVAEAADQAVTEPPLYNADGRKTVSHIASRDLFGGQLELYSFESTPPEWIAAHANSVLAYCASALWSVSGNPKHLTDSLRYAATSMMGMRKCLDLASKHPEFKAEELVYRLLRAEVVGKNYSSAAIHVVYLQQMLKRKAEVGTLDQDSLVMVMHTDNNLALSRMSHPVLESAWLSGILSKSWAQADMLCPDDVSYDIDYRAPSVELHEFLADLNKFFWECSLSRVRGSLANETNWRAVVSRREWLTNRVLHHYLSMIEENGCGAIEDSSVSSVDVLFEQCLVLAAFMALRFQKTIVVVGRNILHSTSGALLHRVSSTFTSLEQLASEDWFHVHAQPVIWIVFVVALIEHKLQAFSTRSQQESPWRERLRQYSKPARLRSWPELSAILRRFPYTPQELPLPYDGWIDEVFAGT